MKYKIQFLKTLLYISLALPADHLSQGQYLSFCPSPTPLLRDKSLHVAQTPRSSGRRGRISCPLSSSSPNGVGEWVLWDNSRGVWPFLQPWKPIFWNGCCSVSSGRVRDGTSSHPDTYLQRWPRLCHHYLGHLWPGLMVLLSQSCLDGWMRKPAQRVEHMVRLQGPLRSRGSTKLNQRRGR